MTQGETDYAPHRL